MKAQGEKGAGTIALQVRINSDNEWEISTDNGNHWTVMKDTSGNPVKATGAKGDKGDAIFSGNSITYAEKGTFGLFASTGSGATACLLTGTRAVDG